MIDICQSLPFRAQDAAICELKLRNKARLVGKEAPELVPNLTKSAGTGTGLVSSIFQVSKRESFFFLRRRESSVFLNN